MGGEGADGEARLRGIVPRAIPVPITFDYAKPSFTGVGKEAAQERLSAIKEQRPDRIKVVWKGGTICVDRRSGRMAAADARAARLRT